MYNCIINKNNNYFFYTWLIVDLIKSNFIFHKAHDLSSFKSYKSILVPTVRVNLNEAVFKRCFVFTITNSDINIMLLYSSTVENFRILFNSCVQFLNA